MAKKMSQKAKDIRRKLRVARKLIEKKENWTTRTFARTIEGYQTVPESPDAIQWCAVGALKRSFGVDDHANDYFVGLKLLKDCIPTRRITTGEVTTFNDASMSPAHHQKVLAMFDCAIEKAADIA